MKFAKKSTLWISLCGVLSLPLSVYYVLGSQPDDFSDTLVQQIENEVKVTTVTLTAGTHTPTIRTFGSVTSDEQLSLFGQVSGEVTWKSPSFKVGHLVKQGDVLLKIEDTT